MSCLVSSQSWYPLNVSSMNSCSGKFYSVLSWITAWPPSWCSPVRLEMRMDLGPVLLSEATDSPFHFLSPQVMRILPHRCEAARSIRQWIIPSMWLPLVNLSNLSLLAWIHVLDVLGQTISWRWLNRFCSCILVVGKVWGPWSCV